MRKTKHKIGAAALHVAEWAGAVVPPRFEYAKDRANWERAVADLRFAYVAYSRHHERGTLLEMWEYWSVLGQNPDEDDGYLVFEDFVRGRLQIVAKHNKTLATKIYRAFQDLGYTAWDEPVSQKVRRWFAANLLSFPG